MKLFVKILMAIALIIPSTTISAIAGNWVMTVATLDGWSVEDGSVSVQYQFVQNPVFYGGGNGGPASTNPRSALRGLVSCCRPYIEVKVKNNTENFVYLDLSKTYMLRNGDTELFQDVMTMSTSNDGGDATKKTLSQNVMPIPPHAAKSLTFPFFNSVAGPCGYQPFIYSYYMYGKEKNIDNTYYCANNNQVSVGSSISFNADNSPAIETISIAYTETEDAEKPTRLIKEFYIDQAWRVKNNKPKELLKLIPNLEDKAYFIILDTTKK